MSIPLSTGAVTAREQSRRRDGKFGTQQHGEQTVALDLADNGTCYECGGELVVDADTRTHVSHSGNEFYPGHDGVLESDLVELAPEDVEAQLSSDTADEAARLAFEEHWVDSIEVPERAPGLPAEHHAAEATWTVSQSGLVHDTSMVNRTEEALAALNAETMRRVGPGLLRTPLGAYYDGDATEREAQDFIDRCRAEDEAIELMKTGVSQKNRDRYRDTPVHDRRMVQPGTTSHLGDGVWGSRCQHCLSLHVSPSAGYNTSLQDHLQDAHDQDPQPLLPSRIRMTTAAKVREDAARDDSIGVPHKRLSTPGHGISAPGLAYGTNGDDVTADEQDGEVVRLRRGKVSFEVPKKMGRDRGAYNDAAVGDRYTGIGKMTLTEKSKAIRQDIKDAVAVGWLPSNLTYSVKTRNGMSIDVDVDGWEDADRHDPQKVELARAEPSWRQRTESAEFFDLQNRIDAIRKRYGRFESDSMQDYWNMDYYGGVHIRDEATTKFWDDEKAKAKARRAELARRKGA